MKISISGHETVLTKDMKDYANEKLSKLDKYGIDIIGMDLVIVEDHNKTEDKAADVKLKVKISGKDIEANAYGKSVFEAIDQVEQKASGQLRKHKEKNLDRSRLTRSKNLIRKFFGRS